MRCRHIQSEISRYNIDILGVQEANNGKLYVQTHRTFTFKDENNRRLALIIRKELLPVVEANIPGYQMIKVVIGEEEVMIINAYTDHRYTDMMHPAAVLAKARVSGARFILLGDFNTEL